MLIGLFHCLIMIFLKWYWACSSTLIRLYRDCIRVVLRIWSLMGCYFSTLKRLWVKHLRSHVYIITNQISLGIFIYYIFLIIKLWYIYRTVSILFWIIYIILLADIHFLPRLYFLNIIKHRIIKHHILTIN